MRVRPRAPCVLSFAYRLLLTFARWHRRRKGKLDELAAARTEEQLRLLAAQPGPSTPGPLLLGNGDGTDSSALRLVEIKEKDIEEEKKRFRLEELKIMRIGLKDR